MHRMQLLLEPWQHEALKTLAARQGKSVSALIREILGRHLGVRPRHGQRHLEELAGVAEGPPDLGRSHDEYLYGRKKPPKKRKR